MTEFPETPEVAPKPKAPLWKRVRGWTFIVTLYVIFAGMAVAGVDLLWRGFRPGVAIDDRILFVFWAIALLFFPAHVARTFLRTKWTTGRWTMSKEARAHQLSQCRARRNPAVPVTPYPWLHFAIRWAIYSASEAAFPLWRRALGWALIAISGATLLGVTGLGLIFIGAGLGGFRSLGWVMVLIGLGILLIPAAVLWPVIRRKRATGSWRTQPEELQAIKVQQSIRRDVGRRQPLRTKIISLAILAAVLTALWIRDTVHRSPHSHETWVTPAIWTAFGIYAAWSQFRKPKSPPAQAPEPPSTAGF